jgi:transporter family protein
MSWIVLAVLSALFLGLYEVAKKSAVTGNAVLPSLLLGSLSGLSVLLPFTLLASRFPAFAAQIGAVPASLSVQGHLLVAAKALLVTSSWIGTYFALKHLPLSIASPVRASAPLFTVLGAVACFQERPSPRQWAGICLILLSYWGFAWLGRKEGIRFGRNPWVWALFAGTLLGALSGLYDKHLLQSAHIPPASLQLWFTLYNAALQAGLVACLWWPQRRSSTPLQLRFSVLLVGALLILADAVYFRALAAPGALVSVVALVRRSNVVVSFALGAVLFREHNRGAKLVPLAGILAGLALLLS